MPETTPPDPLDSPLAAARGSLGASSGAPPSTDSSKTVRQSVPPAAADRTVTRNTPSPVERTMRQTPPPVTLDKTATRAPATARTVTRTPTNPGKTILKSDPNAQTVTRNPGARGTVGTQTRSGQEPDGKPFGRYRLMLELGRGGMGVVWKAYDTQLKRVVALKQILSGGEEDEEQIARFMREARLAAKLRHPNIVGVHDVGMQDGQVYFTTDFVAGRSLDKVLKEQVPPKQAVTWLKQIAEALHYAHEQGVIHRDVKPANVLVDGKGNPFVMDFGLAKEVDQAAGVGDSNLTVSGALLGTPMYMSPEQASGRIDMLGPPTDQFSLGAMMYEMISGRQPFGGGGLRELLNAIIEKDPVPPTRVSAKVHRDLETICLKALEKDPTRRYASLGDLAADLRRWLEGEPIAARPLSAPERWLRWARKRRAVLLPTAAAVVLAIGFGGFAAWKQTQREEQLRTKLEQGRSARAADDPDAAEVAFSAVRDLDGGNAEARDGLAWATSEKERRRLATQTEMTGLASAKETSEAVQKVLSRWVGIADTVRAMEEAFYDSSLGDEAKRERNAAYWRGVQKDFIEGTPDQPVAQAVMQAAAGWAARLAGLETESQEYFAKARSNADLPYGPMMEALVLFSEYLARQPLPRYVVDSTGVRMGDVPTETPEMKDLRSRMEALLARAEGATLWGSDMDEAFRKAIHAVVTLQKGDREEAERLLSEVVRSGELSFCRTSLQFARARVRYLSGNLEDAQVDLDAVSKVRTRQAAVHHFLGEVHYGQGLRRTLAKQDPSPEMDKAIRCYGQALEVMPGFYPSLLNRGLAHLGRIDALRTAGGDALGAARAAFADFDRLVLAQPRYAPGLLDRGIARRELATLGGAEGDASAAYRQAIVDFDAALGADSAMVEAIVNRGMTWMWLGIELKAAELEPAEALGKAIGDFDLALVRRPETSALFWRAYTRMLRVRYGCSKDALADCEAALADVAALPEGYPQAARPKYQALKYKSKLLKDRPKEAQVALEQAKAELAKLGGPVPSQADEAAQRAEFWAEIGEDEHRDEQDARESLKKALGYFDEAVRLSPDSLELRLGRGRAWFYMAWAVGVFRRAEFQNAMRRCVEDMSWILERNPTHVKGFRYRGASLEQLGRYILALADYEKELEGCGGDSQGTVKRILRAKKKMAGQTMTMPPEWSDGCSGAKAKLDAGDAAGAKQAYEAVVADAGPNAEKEPANRRYLGTAYAGLACAVAKLASSDAKARDEAFAHLSKALELGWRDEELLAGAPELEPLRKDARWKTLPQR